MWPKRLGGLAIGVVVALIVTFACEMLSHMVWPPPAGLDLRNMDDATKIVEAMPPAAMMAVVFAWFLGALAGGWAAIRLSGWPVAVWIIVALMLLGVGWSFYTIPHPYWMAASGMIAPVLGGWLAIKLGRRRATL